MGVIIKRYAQSISEVILDDCKISIEEFVAIARYDAKVHFSSSYEERVNKSRKRLEDTLSSDTGIYGVNTGFGDNVRYRVKNDELEKLQENIVRSHGCAVGDPYGREKVRALMLMLLINIGKGYSAVRLEALHLIKNFLNHGITPYVPSESCLGEGLSFCPYIVQALMGEGRIIVGTDIIPSKEVLGRNNLVPLRLKTREGLGLLTNQSPAVAFALPALYDFIIQLRYSDICGALVCEALQCTDLAFDERLIKLKGHPHSLQTAKWMNIMLSGSEIMENSRNLRVQDSTNFRLIPHYHGAAKRMAEEAYKAIMEEFYGIFDNPVFLTDGTALMGANWDTIHTAMYCDALCITTVNMAKLIETHMERLVNTNLSGLPPFLAKKPGVDNGFMLVQYVTCGLLRDITLLCTPVTSYNGSISAGQEAPFSGNDYASFKLDKITKKLNHMNKLVIMTALQAVDYVEGKMSPITKAIYDEVRKTVSMMENDDLLYIRIEAMEKLIDDNSILELVENKIGFFTI